MIANTIIKAALRRLLVISAGSTPSTQQYADGLEVLNDMVNSWSADVDLVYSPSYSVAETLIAGTSEQADSGKSLNFENINLVNATGDIYPVRIVQEDEFNRFGRLNTMRPRRVYISREGDSTLYKFDAVSDFNYTIRLLRYIPFTEFPDGTTDITFPAYYERAFKTNLTLELAPEMGAQKRITPLMKDQAEEAKKTLIGQSVKINESTTELQPRRGYDINGDTY